MGQEKFLANKVPLREKAMAQMGARIRAVSGRPDANCGEETTAHGAFLPVAEKKVAATGGAEIAGENVLWAEPGTQELGAIGFAEIEEDVLGRGLVAGGHPVEPLDGIWFVAGAEFVEPFRGLGKLGEELGGDFGADFVAAPANRGADGGEEVGRPGLKLHLHLAYRFDDDALKCAAPTGVDGSDGALFRVYEENRDAVGGLHAEEKARTVGGGGVALARLGG
jgi:hypothetical protein